jgi:lipoyl(octanoyl) transferase
VLHAPGQLAIYPIVPLNGWRWSARSFVVQFRDSVQRGLAQLQLQTWAHRGAWGLWGRSGLLAAIGVSVQDDITSHGMFLNVNPAPGPFGFVDTVDPQRAGVGERTTMSSLLAERRQPARMAALRSSLVSALAEGFGAERHNIHCGHPWLPAPRDKGREPIVRAS